MLLERAACFRALPNPGRKCSALPLPLPLVRFSSSAQTKRESQHLFGKRATLAAGLTAVVGACAYIAIPRVHAGGAGGVHPATFPWDNKPWNKIFDRASVRRGFQVFKEVCSQCHSLKYVAFRDLIDVTHTEAEVKAIAAEYEVEDGPDDNGDMFMRPAIPNDKWPKPYKNDQAARVANAGALPPDLSLITKARPYGADYVFSLLTGYCDPPPGAEVKDGLHYNPYFPGGWIAMARNLYDGVVEYEDGTPATTSQLAKDVTTFLWWASEPDHDMRKELGPKAFAILIPLTILSWYLKRFKFAAFKSRQIVFNPPKH